MRAFKRFYPGPLANLRRSYAAFHAFDKTHVVALAEANLIPAEASRAILAGLRGWRHKGSKRSAIGWVAGRHSGEAFLTEKLGANVAGWINLGRARRLDAVAWRYNLRQRLPAIGPRSAGCARAFSTLRRGTR
jgi:argininosuccinate lyase